MTSTAGSLCDQYCVFRADGEAYAVAAAGVREVADMLRIVGIPESPGFLVGVCHLRTEFVPVLSLAALLGESTTVRAQPQFLLVITGEEGPWALTIERALTLASLEVAGGHWSPPANEAAKIVLGTATHGDAVLRVIDAQRAYRAASEALEKFWARVQTSHPRPASTSKASPAAV